MTSTRLAARIAGKWFSSFRPSPTVTLLRKSTHNQQTPEPFVVVIDNLNATEKETLRQTLADKSYQCMDYVGSDQKLIVGMDQRLFKQKISRLVDQTLIESKLEQPSQNPRQGR